MTAFQILSKEDLKGIILEALSEHSAQNHRQPEPETDQFLHGLKELAEFAGVGETTAWRLAKTIPAFSTGKKKFFRKSDVLNALQTGGSK